MNLKSIGLDKRKVIDMNQRTKKAIAITMAGLMVFGLFSSLIFSFANM